ncbi:hypothetical protein BC940DRAFT_367911, partial [Gongronella butleri]
KKKRKKKRRRKKRTPIGPWALLIRRNHAPIQDFALLFLLCPVKQQAVHTPLVPVLFFNISYGHQRVVLVWHWCHCGGVPVF